MNADLVFVGCLTLTPGHDVNSLPYIPEDFVYSYIFQQERKYVDFAIALHARKKRALNVSKTVRPACVKRFSKAGRPAPG